MNFFYLFLAAKAGLADFIQPGLVQLQPNIDDFMDTLEPLQSLHG
jgi:MAX-like protein X